MPSLPTMHPRAGSGTKYSVRIKQAILGGRRLNTETLINTFPTHLDDDMEIELINRENVLSSSYQVEGTYFIKVITNRHLKAHRLLTRWRNIVFRMSRLSPPFTSYDTALEMAEYEYNAASHLHENNGSIATPYEFTQLHNSSSTAAILYKYIPNTGKFENDDKTLKAFEHIVKNTRKLHNAGYTHTSLPFHIVKSVPEGEPYLTDPIGRTQNTDQAQLTGIGFDIATLLARYTPHVGTLPALKILGEHYSDVELIAAYKTATPIQVTVPGTPRWVITHLKTSINEYVNPGVVETYLKIMSNSGTANTPTGSKTKTVPTTNQHNETPYSTKEFIQAVVNGSPDPEKNTEQTTSTTQTYSTAPDNQNDNDIRIGAYKTGDPITEPASPDSFAPTRDTGLSTSPESLKSPTENTPQQPKDPDMPSSLSDPVVTTKSHSPESDTPNQKTESGIMHWLTSILHPSENTTTNPDSNNSTTNSTDNKTITETENNSATHPSDT